MSEFNLTEALLKVQQETGATQEEMQAKIRLAIEKGNSIETLINTQAKAIEVSEKQTEILNKMIVDRQAEQEALAFEDEKKNALELISKNGDDEVIKSFLAGAAQRIGVVNASFLDPRVNPIQKMLNIPISKSNPEYEEIMQARHAMDLVCLSLAYTGAAYEASDPNFVEVNKSKLKYNMGILSKGGLAGMDVVEKAIGQALDEQTATEGLEWVPQQILSRNMYQDVWLQLMIPSQFTRFQAPGPTFAVPIRTARGRGFCMDEAQAVTDYFLTSVNSRIKSSAFSTGKVTFNARKVGVLEMVSDELTQDSAVAILERLYEEITYGMADAIEDATINGSRNASLNDLDNQGADTHRLWANTNDQGDGIRLNTGLSDARYLWNGLRKNALSGATVTPGGATLARSDFLNIRGKMQKYGVKSEDLFLIVSPATYIKMLAFPEVATMEKYGTNATVVRGELARLDNIPIFVSPRVNENEDNLGYFTDGTVVGGSAGSKTYSEILLVHRLSYAFADRLVMRVESDRQILSQQRAVIGSARLDFEPMFPNTERTVGRLTGLAV